MTEQAEGESDTSSAVDESSHLPLPAGSVADDGDDSTKCEDDEPPGSEGTFLRNPTKVTNDDILSCNAPTPEVADLEPASENEATAPYTDASGDTLWAVKMSELDGAFTELMSRAGSLGANDHQGARELLCRACEARLPNGEMALLEARIAKATGLTRAVIKALTSDAANFSPGHGFPDSFEALAQALQEDYERRFEKIIATQSKFYTYSAEASVDTPEAETGYWRPRPTEQLEADLLKSFQRNPLVQKPGDRKEILKRFYLRNNAGNKYLSDASPGLNLSNGFLAMDPVTKSVTLCPHSPEHRATFKLAFAYDPDVSPEIFKDGLLKMVGENENKAICIVQFMAATLFGFMPPLDKVRTVLILYGRTGSGKSTLTKLLQRFVPKNVQSSISPELWSQDYHLEKLMGARLNTVTELAGGATLFKGATFKLVASHEPVTARQIRQEPVTFVPRVMNLLSCNTLPKLDERDPSVGRRLSVIALPEAAPEFIENADFLEQAWAEAPGIVNLMVEMLQEMLESGRFTIPADNQKQVLRMQYPAEPEEHVAQLWLERAPGERVWSEELQAALRIEAAELGVDSATWADSAKMRQLSQRISNLHGAERHMTNGRVFYEGVRFVEGYRGKVGHATQAAASPVTPRRRNAKG